MRTRPRISTVLVASVLALPVHAQTSEDVTGIPYELQCEDKGTNGMVTLLLCPEGLSQEEFAQEGRAACGGRKPCGAWIWVDLAAVPAEAPDSHDKLPQAAVASAVAIWVNETQQLVVLERAQKE